MTSPSSNIDFILSPIAIRERSARIYELAKTGGTHFRLDEIKIEEVANFVIDVIKYNYPDLNIPYHSRWGHFQVGGVDRLAKLNALIRDLDPVEKARIKYDLVIPSVLLDAGAGTQWKYSPADEKKTYNRSEGLAVASFDMFISGAFSKSTAHPWKAHSTKLSGFTPEDIIQGLQVSDDNPLEGLAGRANLIAKLGSCLKKRQNIFADGRPGNLVDFLLNRFGKTIAASDILNTILINLGDIWPGRIVYENVNLGDVWEYPPIGHGFDGFVPFHKLSQWLTYSLIEPLEELGVVVSGVDNLTGLAEYRNGGLFVDMEVLNLRDQSLKDKFHKPGSELIIEWRALTIQLLDRVADLVRSKLNLTAEAFPLAKVLEGGTWWAGRKVAKSKRPDGSPPIKLASDGTVF